MKVTVDLEPADVWFLETKAQARGMSLSQWLRGAVLSQFSRQLTTRDRVAILHRNGATDGEMSLRLQISRGRVAELRRELHLKPNKHQHNIKTKETK
jgi:hypothetical protein